ncbi:3-hydroxyisobutyrate dehydrogenase, mitochondrial [Liparis tanakae]|uniref:3-hydroxyisobutyrate dehydrogenase, mitochondrial n=1 Tax=Liparis tanakae TaxID=230148 RepID=A0A4Z2IMN9_9TELE|nr:3-hydroxyisobutyrate dehydrogenase, mitochondrial [Liparis tanakae]
MKTIITVITSRSDMVRSRVLEASLNSAANKEDCCWLACSCSSFCRSFSFMAFISPCRKQRRSTEARLQPAHLLFELGDCVFLVHIHRLQHLQLGTQFSVLQLPLGAGFLLLLTLLLQALLLRVQLVPLVLQEGLSSRSMASKTQVGFIGLGNMGNPMAKNLLKHGYPVIATDVFPESCKELQELGAQIVDHPAEVADKADRIITMLPSSPNVREVYTGPNGILKKVKKGSLLIDSSTIDPAVSKEMAAAAEKMGAVFMDAPVSGGVGAASSGKLTFMVGGAEEEFTAAKELLTCMGANVVYCGQVGTGQILNMSSGRCWSSDTYNPVPGVMEGVPSGNNYQGGFGTQLMAKDLGLAQDTATNTKTPVPLGSLAHQIYRMMCARGYASKDFSSVFQFLREEEEGGHRGDFEKEFVVSM